jgi:hypothetical protein
MVNTREYYLNDPTTNLDGIIGRSYTSSKRDNSVGHKYVIIQTNKDSKTALSEFEKDMNYGKIWQYDEYRS